MTKKTTKNVVEMNHKQIQEVLQEGYKTTPQKLILRPLIWKYLVRSVIRAKNLGFIGYPGCGKTMASRAVALALGRPLFMIPMNAASDPRTNLLGTPHFKNGETTFVYAEFIKAIQTPNAVVVLDELNRAHPDATNILLSPLDEEQRYVRIDETGETIKVAPGVSFMATANVGPEFVGTNRIDRALMDRFDWVEIQPMSADDEFKNLTSRFGDRVEEKLLQGIANLAGRTREIIKQEGTELDSILSTRKCEAIASLVADGFSIMEALEVSAYPLFSDMGGVEGSSRALFLKLVQEIFPPEGQDDNLVQNSATTPIPLFDD